MVLGFTELLSRQHIINGLSGQSCTKHADRELEREEWPWTSSAASGEIGPASSRRRDVSSPSAVSAVDALEYRERSSATVAY